MRQFESLSMSLTLMRPTQRRPLPMFATPPCCICKKNTDQTVQLRCCISEGNERLVHPDCLNKWLGHLRHELVPLHLYACEGCGGTVNFQKQLKDLKLVSPNAFTSSASSVQALTVTVADAKRSWKRSNRKVISETPAFNKGGSGGGVDPLIRRSSLRHSCDSDRRMKQIKSGAYVGNSTAKATR